MSSIRLFKMQSKFVSGNVKREVFDYRWTKSKGLECFMFGRWVRSEYSLKEFVSGMNGSFLEIKP